MFVNGTVSNHVSVALAVVLVALGLAVRVWCLVDQIPVGDEWHTLHALAEDSAGRSLLDPGIRYSVPYVWYLLGLSRILALNEFWLYLPVMVASIGTYLVLPLLARELVSRASRVLFLGLLAISPILVYYGRTARPYALTTLLATLAVLLLWSWRRRGGVHRIIAATILAMASVRLQMVVLPLVCAPLLWFWVNWLLKMRTNRGGRQGDAASLVVATSAYGLGVLAVGVLPGLFNPSTIAAKTGEQLVTSDTVFNAVRLMLGFSSTGATVAAIPLILFGFVVMWKRSAPLTSYLVTVGLIQIVAVIVVEPTKVSSSIVFVRYVLPVAPLVLLAFSQGVTSIGSSLITMTRHSASRVEDGVQITIASVVIAVLGWYGATLTTMSYPDNWYTYRLWEAIMASDPTSAAPRIEAANRRSAVEMSEFYRDIGRLPAGTVRLVEFPWLFRLSLNALPSYQRAHRQWTSVGMWRAGDSSPRGSLDPSLGTAWRNMVFLDDAEALLDRSIRYVVIHRDVLSEVHAADRVAPSAIRGLRRSFPPLDEVTTLMGKAWGDPVFEDGELIVYSTTPAED